MIVPPNTRFDADLNSVAVSGRSIATFGVKVGRSTPQHRRQS